MFCEVDFERICLTLWNPRAMKELILRDRLSDATEHTHQLIRMGFRGKMQRTRARTRVTRTPKEIRHLGAPINYIPRCLCTVCAHLFVPFVARRAHRLRRSAPPLCRLRHRSTEKWRTVSNENGERCDRKLRIISTTVLRRDFIASPEFPGYRVHEDP